MKPILVLTAALLLVLVMPVHADVGGSAHDGNTGLTTTRQYPFPSIAEVTSFYAQGLYWLFYNSGACTRSDSNPADNACVYFSTSADDVQWAAPTNTSIPVIAGDGFLAVTHNSSMVFLNTVFFNLTLGGFSQDLFQYGSLAPIGTVSWAATQKLWTAVFQASGTFANTMVLSTSGQIFLTGIGSGGTGIWHSGSAALNSWQFLQTGTLNIRLAALPNGNVYEAATVAPLVQGRLWFLINNTWGATENIYQQSGPCCPGQPVGAVYADTLHVYLIVRDGGTLSAMFCVRTVTNNVASWNCRVIEQTTSQQIYLVAFASVPAIFTIFLVQQGSWFWFTFDTFGNPLSNTQMLALASFTVGTNGISYDDGFSSITPSVYFTDLYWTQNMTSPFPIFSGQLVLSSSGQTCFSGNPCNPLPSGGGGSGGGQNSPGPIVVPVLVAVAAQTFWSTFFSNAAGVIILGWILFIIGATVYGSVHYRRKRKANRPSYATDRPVKPRKQTFKV